VKLQRGRERSYHSCPAGPDKENLGVCDGGHEDKRARELRPAPHLQQTETCRESCREGATVSSIYTDAEWWALYWVSSGRYRGHGREGEGLGHRVKFRPKPWGLG